MRLTLLICFVFLLGAAQLAAQVPSRAVRLYNRALGYQQQRHSDKAEQTMRRAIREYPFYTEAYRTLGKWLFDRHQYGAAAELYLQGERTCQNGPQLFGRLATVSMAYSGNFSEALKRIPQPAADSATSRLLRQITFMAQEMKPGPKRYGGLLSPVGTPMRINTGAPELFPFPSADGRRLYFTRRVNGVDDDLYYAERDSCGEWLNGRNMGSPPNSSGAEIAQALSADRHYLFLTRCDNRSPNGWDGGGCDLYMAYTADSVWSVPLGFGATINTPAFEGMPALSSDNRELFFVSDRPGGFGGMDIWSARFEHGLWQLPRNLGPAVNTAGNETAPFICADNETLYFASTGHTGMGGSDLFVSRRINDTTWGPALNLGYPVNTVYEEASVSLNAAGDTLLLASDRDSTAGDYNIYQVPLPPDLRPRPVRYYSGYVLDSLTRGGLNYANIYFTDDATGQEVYQAVSNRGDGSYTIALAAGHHYSLLISRIGYQQLMDTIRCDSAQQVTAVLHNFPLLPVGYEQPVKDTLVLSVYFKKNITTLNDSDAVQITGALQPWLSRNGVSVLVNGYTDNSGTPLLNEQFSMSRARAVGDVLRSAGVPEAVLQIQGWGEANPRADNDTEENRDKNRRVEIVIRL